MVFIAQFYIAVWPLGGQAENPSDVAVNFFQHYLAVVVALAFWIGGYLWKRSKPRKASEIDLDVSRVEMCYSSGSQNEVLTVIPFFFYTYRPVENLGLPLSRWTSGELSAEKRLCISGSIDSFSHDWIQLLKFLVPLHFVQAETPFLIIKKTQSTVSGCSDGGPMLDILCIFIMPGLLSMNGVIYPFVLSTESTI